MAFIQFSVENHVCFTRNAAFLVKQTVYHVEKVGCCIEQGRRLPILPATFVQQGAGLTISVPYCIECGGNAGKQPAKPINYPFSLTDC